MEDKERGFAASHGAWFRISLYAEPLDIGSWLVGDLIQASIFLIIVVVRLLYVAQARI